MLLSMLMAGGLGRALLEGTGERPSVLGGFWGRAASQSLSGEVLHSIGVGASNASPLLGALTWQDASDTNSLTLFLDFLYSSSH